MQGPFPYVGGKNRLAKKIISLLPEHTTYVEPFAGGAQVFFHKQPSRVEVLNDLNEEIVNFFRVCQSHYEELIRCLRFTVASRRLHELLSNTPAQILTDIQRAARFFYLQKNSFGGLVVRRNFHYSVGARPNFRPERIPELLVKTHQRLQAVQIECLAFQDVIRKYDRPATFFYLDPPYWDRELYKFNLKEEDFVDLEKLLRHVKGKFMLSLNDVPEVRKLFAKFSISDVTLAYSTQKRVGKRYSEVIIRNF